MIVLQGNARGVGEAADIAISFTSDTMCDMMQEHLRFRITRRSTAPMSPRRIAILFHEGDRHRDTACYAIHHFRKYWEADGHSVVHLFGVRRFEPADVVLVHVNLSVVPDEYIQFASRYPIVLNAGIRDIRKSSFTHNRAAPGDGWAGPVIVKSDLNYAGEPERMLRRTWLERSWQPARRARRLFDRLAGGTMPFETSMEYPVYDSLADVPPAVFTDARVVVERFRPEIENDLYHLTAYQFLGDRSTCTRFASPHPVIKASHSVAAEEVEPHEGILEWREKLAIDYGKLDYVVCDGEAILLDANKTTGMGTYYSDDRHDRLRRNRAEGLYCYFRNDPRARTQPHSAVKSA